MYQPVTSAVFNICNSNNNNVGSLFGSMAACSMKEKLDAVTDVDIDDSGTFKYVLIKVDNGKDSKFIVRGYDWAEFHADIFDDVASGLKTLGLNVECCGGGRIKHNSKESKILVYGYSMGFGRANHQITVDLLKEHYPNYKAITFSNDGY